MIVEKVLRFRKLVAKFKCCSEEKGRGFLGGARYVVGNGYASN